MSTGQLAKTGATISLFGIAINQLWLVGGVLVLVGVTALVIRARFRRGRAPHEH